MNTERLSNVVYRRASEDVECAKTKFALFVTYL